MNQEMSAEQKHTSATFNKPLPLSRSFRSIWVYLDTLINSDRCISPSPFPGIAQAFPGFCPGRAPENALSSCEVTFQRIVVYAAVHTHRKCVAYVIISDYKRDLQSINLVHYSQMLKTYCNIFAFIFNSSFLKGEGKCPNSRQVTRKLDCFDLGPQGATNMIPFQELTKPTT